MHKIEFTLKVEGWVWLYKIEYYVNNNNNNNNNNRVNSLPWSLR